MIRVLGRLNSSNVQKVVWTLAELGLPFEREDFGGSFGGTREPAYLRLNPNATIPTLVDGDVAVWESNTTLRYLAGKAQRRDLLPDDLVGRQAVERWMDWQLWTMAGTVAPFIHGRMQGRTAEELEPQRVKIADKLAVLDGVLGQQPYAAGDSFTLAELALGPMVYRWFGLPIRREELPHLAAWYARLTERPAYARYVMLPLA